MGGMSGILGMLPGIGKIRQQRPSPRSTTA